MLKSTQSNEVNRSPTRSQFNHFLTINHFISCAFIITIWQENRDKVLLLFTVAVCFATFANCQYQQIYLDALNFAIKYCLWHRSWWQRYHYGLCVLWDYVLLHLHFLMHLSFEDFICLFINFLLRQGHHLDLDSYNFFLLDFPLFLFGNQSIIFICCCCLTTRFSLPRRPTIRIPYLCYPL